MTCRIHPKNGAKLIAYVWVAQLLVASITPIEAQPEAEEAATAYGSLEAEESSLIGILYDLKQDQKQDKKRMHAGPYDNLVNEFLSSKWDEPILNRYFRVSRPLYTSQIFIPLSPANWAPTAFGVDEVVKPSFWMVHYKGQVAPPSSGRWRFWGYGSEVCSVAVNGKTVLAANYIESGRLNPIKTPDLDWESSAPLGRKIHRGRLTAGSWMELEGGEIIDLDVLIGERAGGNFSAVLYIEKAGETYEMQDGHPVFPIFKLRPSPPPLSEKYKKIPPFAENGPIWIGAP